MSEATERLMEGAHEVQGAVLATCIRTRLDAREFPDDAAVKEVFAFTVKVALDENWMEPPAPGQLVLGSAVAATHEWLKRKSRDKEADDLVYEAKVLFALMNDPGRFAELLASNDIPADFVAVGVKVIWKDVCKAEGFNENTAQRR